MQSATRTVSTTVDVSVIHLNPGEWASLHAGVLDTYVQIEMKCNDDGTIQICCTKPDMVQTFEAVYGN